MTAHDIWRHSWLNDDEISPEQYDRLVEAEWDGADDYYYSHFD